MNPNQKIEILKKELEAWEKLEKEHREEYATFNRGYVIGAIESLKRAIRILEELL